MSKTAPDLSANGWPLLTADHYIDAVPLYTQELADKLDNSDADVAAAINAADQAQQAYQAIVEEFVDSGEIPLTPEAGYTGGSGGCSYRIVNGICYLSGLITRDAGAFPSAYSTVMVLPPAARPSRNTEAAPFLTRTGDALGIVVVQTSGQVRAAGGSAPGTDRLALDSIRPYRAG